MSGRIAVVVSQGQSQNPEKRGLEESLVAELIGQSSAEIVLIPNLYDLTNDDPALLALEGISGPMIVLSWHYPRGAFWSMAQLGIEGTLGTSLLTAETQEDETDEDETKEDDSAEQEKTSVSGNGENRRKIYCIDFRSSDRATDYLEEIERIRREETTKVLSLGIVADAKRVDEPIVTDQEIADEGTVKEGAAQRRWYPVIDYGRCTNCMECVDFCLFGVYGVDQAEQILVEQPDNCRKGCPACSRVCPENAIIFPQHKSPAIAGGAFGGAGLKIDLSKLFGAPSAVDVAAKERDEQLVMAGRTPVGNKQEERDAIASKRNELDDMLDELDTMEL